MAEDALLQHLPYARRYARMLLGRQDDGDRLVADGLQYLAAHARLLDFRDLRVMLFCALHDVLGRRPTAAWFGDGSSMKEQIADRRLQSMAMLPRAALLLTAVEGFCPAAAADILDVEEADVLGLADEAQRMVERDLETTVLIIEDQWAIARDLRQIVNSLGHEVVAVAATGRDAIDLAARHKPGLVIADLQLADGSSGADAASEIIRARMTPTVFVTAYPKMLLDRPYTEPTYLITKPFSPSMIKTTVSQALFFS